jgi:hypothetical protein
MIVQRPSHKELLGKLREARTAVAARQVMILAPEVLACDAIDLGYLVADELVSVLLSILDEVDPRDYVGKRPPDRSYKPDIDGLELFAFVVRSRWFGCQVYLKFALHDGVMWLVSLHRSRAKKERS